MIQGEAWYMIRELLREGLSVSEIARRSGRDRKTIRKVRQPLSIQDGRSAKSGEVSLTPSNRTYGIGPRQAC